MPQISIVIPAYNEQKRLPRSISRLKRLLDETKPAAEVIIVVEQSSDGTLAAARKAIKGDARFRVIDNKVHRGKGYAVRHGMLEAKGEYVFFMDADLSTDTSAIPRFIRYFQRHPDIDILVGSREHTGTDIVIAQNFLRRSMGRVFNGFVRTLVLSGIRDTQCGFKAFRRTAAQRIFKLQSIDGFAFDVEVLLLARRLNYKTAVLPVVWANSADSKVNILGGSLQMLKDLLVIRRKWHGFSQESEAENTAAADLRPAPLEITDV